MTKSLIDVLEQARASGFLGPGPVSDHVDHAANFARSLPDDPCHYIDLGAGGGLPSLPILVSRPDTSAVLLDASQRRCSFLVWASVELGLTERVDVWTARAEVVGHEQRARSRFDAVVARSFGPPAWTAECAAPLLVAGGRLLISEPPGGRAWPTEGLARMGLALCDTPLPVAVFERRGQPPDELPRSSKEYKKDPYF